MGATNGESHILFHQFIGTNKEENMAILSQNFSLEKNLSEFHKMLLLCFRRKRNFLLFE